MRVCFSQAAANTRIVGLEVAHFINTLVVTNVEW